MGLVSETRVSVFVVTGIVVALLLAAVSFGLIGGRF